MPPSRQSSSGPLSFRTRPTTRRRQPRSRWAKRLFQDKELSSTGTVACASCHDPKLSFSDGEPRGKGVTGQRLVRHTPSLWNVAFSPLLFWDGRAASLEEQVRFPVEHPDEMGDTLDNAVHRFARHASYERDFAVAFPADPKITARNIARALAAYERTLVSPPTRFDQWIAGDGNALTQSAINGLKLFAGKGRCIGCHTGFAFTDRNFYDIGLPGADPGRGKEIDLPVADHAFKTPTLRELAWTAPYMHDGSLATLDEVIRHYEKGGVRRPTRSKDLPQNLRLSELERGYLIAFLESLSSDTPPQPSTEPWVGSGQPAPPPPPEDTTVISQANKLFAPNHVRLRAGETLTVLNDDTRTHNVRIFDPRFDFNSGAQEPKETVTIRFPVDGTFEAFCGIHPSMRLQVDVQ
ncbi:MAG: cytochrome C peroxidase [Sphingomonadales bacterium]|nr:cytochrome C peroxidase [Sphingomonadales bacterium]